MFANLVESNPHRGDYRRKGSFFLGTLAVYGVIFLAIGVGGVYAYNNHIENKDLELVYMVPPAEQPVEQPAVKRSAAPRASSGEASNSAPRPAVFKVPPAMVSTDPTLTPNKTYVSSPVNQLPVGTDFKIGANESGRNIFGPGAGTGDGTGRSGGGGVGGGREAGGIDDTLPPPMKAVAETKALSKTYVKSLGVVNGMAKYLPKPVYSAIARAARAHGTVQVQVLIDEQGKVISASPVNGNPLLQREAVQAALQARFTPTLLSNQPVKVSGIITYNFVQQ